MDLNAITVADFKAQFFRDLPYLNNYSAGSLYNVGTRVFYPTTQLFYDCTVNGTTNVLPTVIANWTVAADSAFNYVQDQDITRAFAEAQVTFNQGLWTSDTVTKMAYLYLTAHYLVNDLRTANSPTTAMAAFPISSRSVGSVSESYNIPEAFSSNPFYAFLIQSGFGQKYLTMLLPNLVGNFGSVYGGTNA